MGSNLEYARTYTIFFFFFIIILNPFDVTSESGRNRVNRHVKTNRIGTNFSDYRNLRLPILIPRRNLHTRQFKSTIEEFTYI